MAHPLRTGPDRFGKSEMGLDKEAAYQLASRNAGQLDYDGKQTIVQRVVHVAALVALCTAALVLGVELVALAGGVGVQTALLKVMQPLVLLAGSGEMLAAAAGGTLVALAAVAWATRGQ